MNVLQRWIQLLLVVTVGIIISNSVFALSVEQRGNQVFIDGKMTPLTFARGLQDPTDLPIYHALGFNTVIVTVDSPGTRGVGASEGLIAAAEKEGLYVLVELANGAWSANKYLNLESKDYVTNAQYYLDAVVPRLSVHPNVIGWVISTVDEDQSVSNINSLQNFLRIKYGTIDNLNRVLSEQQSDSTNSTVLKANIPSFSILTSPAVYLQFAPKKSKTIAERILDDVKEYQGLLKERDTSFQSYLKTHYSSLDDLSLDWQCRDKWRFASWDDITVDKVLQHDKEQPEASTASVLELARYRAMFPSLGMDWWAKEIVQRTKGQLIFAGNQHRYRTLISLPSSLNGAITECYPGYAEADLENQNPQAVDIARRGNSFAVLAGVLAQSIPPYALANALYAAAVHGAAGVCITDWPTIRTSLGSTDSLTYAHAVKASLDDMAQRNLLGRIPAPKTAIVYSPYAPGHTAGTQSIYGYMSNFIYPGPDLFFFAFRNGSSFGQLDFLASSDLAKLPLDKYRTILLPSVLDIPEDAQDALLKYTQDGGTVLADIGLGTLQANKNMLFLPVKLMQLFNVNNTPGIRKVHYNLEMNQPDIRFPGINPGLRATGLNRGYMVARSARVIPLGGTQVLFTMVEDTGYGEPKVNKRKPLKPEPTDGMFIYQQGKGFAIYAPFPLYQFWLSQNMLFGMFHHDLMGYKADIELLRPIDFLPSMASVASYADGSIIAWTKDMTRPEVAVDNPSRRLYAVDQGACCLSPEKTTLSYASPGFHVAELLPASIDSIPFTVNYLQGAITNTTDTFALECSDEDATKVVTARIASGIYPIAPGTSHRVTVTTQAGQQVSVMKADQQGQLVLSLPARCHVQIDGNTTVDQGQEVVIDVIPTSK